MKAKHPAHLPIRQGICLVAGVILATGLLQAAPGGKGVGNAIAPPVPYVESLECLVPGVTRDLAILGQVSSNESFVEKKGNETISGSFSDAGITINSITVNSATSLTLNVTVDTDATLTTSTLTITNPDGLSATSTAAVVCVTDIPQITATEVTPIPPSVIQNIDAVVTGVISEENSFPVTFEYQWYENGVAIAQTSSTLPSSATIQNRNYYCEITPVKNGSVRGATIATTAVTVVGDADNNGLHDAWEIAYLGSTGNNPNLDADGDGLSNRAEYLFGLNPNNSQSNRPIVKPLDPTTGQFEYRRALDKVDGVNYRVETSSDLVNWTIQTGITEAINAGPQSEVVTVGLDQALISANSRLFVRVSVQ